MAKKFGIVKPSLSERSSNSMSNIENIVTPTNKASFGNTEQIVKAVLNDNETIKVLQYIGTIFFDGKKVSGNNVSSLISSLTSSNVLTSIRKENEKMSNSLKSIETQMNSLLNIQAEYYSAMINSGNISPEILFKIALDTTKAENFDKILEAIAKVGDDDVKKMAELFSAANKISYIDLSDLEKNFIMPLNKFVELQCAEISEKISDLSDNKIIEKLAETINGINSIPIANADANIAFDVIDSFLASLYKMMTIEKGDVESISETLPSINSILIGSETSAGIKEILENLSSIKANSNENEAVLESIMLLAKSMYVLAQMTDFLRDDDKDTIIASIDNANSIIRKVKEIEKFSEKDKEEIEKSSESLNLALSSFTVSTENSYKEIEKVSKMSDASQKNLEKIMIANDSNIEKIEDAREKSDEINDKKPEIAIAGIGSAILKIGATMLIGTYLITKNPDMMKKTIEFGAALAAFIALTVGPLMIISVIGQKLGSSSDAIDGFGNTIIKLSATLLVATLVYSKFGIDRVSEAARAFSKDLTILTLCVVGVIAIAAAIAKNDYIVTAFGKTVSVLAIVMSIGAVFMLIGGGKFAIAAVAFGLTLAIFTALILIPIKLMGGFLGTKLEATSSLGRFVAITAAIMSIGAVFMLIGGGKFALAALGFGITLGLFITLLILPLKLITKGVFGAITAKMCIEQLTDFVATVAAVMLIGGIFMTIFGGKLAIGALKFAILMSAFIFAITYSLHIMMRGMGWANARIIRRFKDTVETIALILIAGGLLMMIPGFGKNALQFAVLTTLFVASMALVFILLGRSLTPRRARTILLFGVTMFLLIATIVFSVNALKNVNFKQFLKTLGFIALAIVVFVGIALIIGAPFINKLIRRGVINLFLLSVSLALFGFTISLAAMIVSQISLKQLLLLTGIMLGLVAIFAIIGIPPVAIIIGIGVLVMTGIAIAMLLISAVFLMIHFLVNKFDLNKDLKMLEGVISSLVPIFVTLSTMIVIAVLGAVSAILIGVALTFLTVGFLVIHILAKINIKADVKKLTTGVESLWEMFTLLTVMIPIITIGTVSAVLMGISLTFLGIGFGTLHLLAKNMKIKEIDVLSEGLLKLSGVYVLLGLLMVPITLGTVSAIGIGTSMTMLSIGFGALHLLTKNLKEKEIDVLNSGLRKLKNTYSFLGLLIIPITLGSIAAVELSTSLILVSAAFSQVHKMTENMKNFDEEISVIEGGINSSLSIFSVLRENKKTIRVGGRSARRLAKSLTSVGNAFTIVSEVVKNNPDLQNYINVFGDSLKACVEIFTEKLKDVDWKDLKSIARQVKRTMRPIIRIASRLFSVVKDFATLMVPDRWNNDGVATHYKQLKQSDFQDASESIGLVFSTLINSFAEMPEKHPKIKKMMDDFKESGDPTTAIGRLFKRGTSDFSILIRMATTVTKAVGDSADVISKLATLMVPDRWNTDGIAIHYRTMKSEDFTTAAEGVDTIMTTLMNSVASIYTNHKDLIDKFRKEGDDSPLAAILEIGTKIGEMLTSMSESISNYSQLKIPTGFNANGKATGYRRLKEKDFTDVGINVEKILLGIIDPIQKAYEKAFKGNSKAFKNTDDINTIIETVTSATNMLSSVAKTISDIAQLKIPIYASGKIDPVGYRTISEQDFIDLGTNVKTILEKIPKAIVDAWGTIQIDPEIFKNIAESFKPMSEMLANIVQCIKDYASMKYVPLLDKDGKITEYKEFDMDKDLSSMSTNVASLITGMSNALIDAYNKFKQSQQKGDEEVIGDVISAFVPIGDLMKNLIDTVISYSQLKVPKYNEKGEIAGYHTLVSSPNEMKSLFKKIGENLNLIMSGLLEAATSALKPYSKGGTKEKEFEAISESASNFSEIISPVSQIIDLVKNYSELKFPLGFDSDGKVKGYKTIENFDFVEFRRTLKKMISSFPKALSKALIESKVYFDILEGKMNTDENDFSLSRLQSNLQKISSAMTDVYKLINDFSNLKIPEAFDKNGKPIRYIVMNEASFDKLSRNAELLIVTMPKALKNAIEKTKFDDTQLEKLEGLISVINSAQQLIGSLYSIENINFINDCATKSEEYGKQIKAISEQISLSVDIIQNGIFGKMIELLKNVIDNFSNNGKFSADVREKLIVDVAMAMQNLGELTEILTFNSDNSDKLKKSNEDLLETRARLQTIKSMMATVNDISNDLLAASTLLSLLNVNNIEKLPISAKLLFANEFAQHDLAKNAVSNYKKFNKIAKYILDISESLSNAYPLLEKLDDNFLDKFNIISYKLLKSPIVELDADRSMKRNYKMFSEIVEEAVESMAKLTIMSFSLRMMNSDNGFLDEIDEFNGIALRLLDKDVASVLKYASKDAKNKYSLFNEALETMPQITFKLFSSDLFLKLVDKDDFIEFSSITDTLLSKTNSIYGISKEDIEKYKKFKKISDLLVAISVSLSSSEMTMKMTETAAFEKLNSIAGEIINEEKSQIAGKIMKSHVSDYAQMLKLVGLVNLIAMTLSISSNIMENVNESNLSKINSVAKSLIESPIMNMHIDDSNANSIIKFNELSNTINEATESIKKSSSNLDNVHESNFEKIKSILVEINEAIEASSWESVKKLDSESESLNKFVKTINSIQPTKIGATIRLFDSITNLASNIGNLNEFTKTLANEVSVALVELTKEIDEAKSVIATAERQRAKRQEALDKSIEKIDRLMSKPLKVNVSSASGETLSAAYETPKE